jgi:lipopolysaccharide/colanic/teichoic acid biosynthesis glycosyltransferase
MIALCGVVLLAPLFALATLLILADDGPPVLFRQRRIGKQGRPFTMLKFRSMRAGLQGMPLTVQDDRRVTAAGAWLRAFKIDELPQLFNVLHGSMGLIGPRPEVPECVAFEDELWCRVLELRPGITDLASLAFRQEEAILGPLPDPEAYYRSVLLPEKLRLNLQYERSRSLGRDLKLLWLTVRYAFSPGGSTLSGC